MMAPGTLTIDGKRFVVIPEHQYEDLLSNSLAKETLPPLPKQKADGSVPAIAYARASLARKLIAGRKRAGWSQAELARRASVRAETVHRIEHGKNTPDEKTFAKFVKALSKAGIEI